MVRLGIVTRYDDAPGAVAQPESSSPTRISHRLHLPFQCGLRIEQSFLYGLKPPHLMRIASGLALLKQHLHDGRGERDEDGGEGLHLTAGLHGFNLNRLRLQHGVSQPAGTRPHHRIRLYRLDAQPFSRRRHGRP